MIIKIQLFNKINLRVGMFMMKWETVIQNEISESYPPLGSCPYLTV